jgi:pimeloyl-ACP methyl ester carboxylesterase
LFVCRELAMTRFLFVLLLWMSEHQVWAQASAPQAAAVCGEVITIPTHRGTTTRYALSPAFSAAPSASVQPSPVALVMLIGGGGYMNLDDKGCPQLLGRNVLVRMSPLLHQAGVSTALVDAPSDMQSDEGLAGFRISPDHAEDVGKIIADVRARTQGAVWLVGHSRGSISAANVAARLSGPAAPDGVVLLSALMVGDNRARKAWVAQSVFTSDLGAIKIPLLLVGHVADNCTRSPPGLMDSALAKSGSPRGQVALVSGGPVVAGRAESLAACEPREPHDFVEQEGAVAAGLVRFLRGGAF